MQEHPTNTYYISRNYKFTKNAASKPKMDCEHVLAQNGFKNLGLAQTNLPSSALGAIVSFFGIAKGLVLLPRKAVFCMQYPLSKFFGMVSRVARLKGCTLIMIVHDVKYLMGKQTSLKKEMAKFNRADYLVLHNPEMRKWFQENGCTAKIVDLNLFDYIHKLGKAKPFEGKVGSFNIAFAGGLGLEKSAFLYELDALKPKSFRLNLYGNGLLKDRLKADTVLDYRGSFAPEAVVDHITGDFGLVWNGETLDQCSGAFGAYLKYNNPHKTSLYLVGGLPIIVWKDAAIAQFVVEQGLGIAIDSLQELDGVLEQMDVKTYKAMFDRAQDFREKVANGYFLSDAIQRVLVQLD